MAVDRLKQGCRAGNLLVNRAFAAVGAVTAAAAMFLITGDVLGRFFLNRPIAGTLEVSEVMLAVMIFSSVAYYEMTEGHIRITGLRDRLPLHARLWIDVFGKLICAAFMAMMAVRMFSSAMQSWAMHETTSGSMQVPIVIPKMAIFFGAALLAIYLAGSSISISLDLVRGREISGGA